MDTRVQFISNDIFKNKVCSGVLGMDEVYRYLQDDQSNGIPVEIEFAALFICQRGESDIMLDMKTYHIKEGDLCVVFPHMVIQGLCRSDDFDGYGMAANLDYISSIQIPSAMQHFLRISENPCISLAGEEQNKLLKICELVKLLQEVPASHMLHDEVINHLSLALCYEIVGIYTQRKPIEEQVYSRQDTIFRKFMFSLAKNCKEHREVSFYAEEQCLTPRYFSSVVREISGAHAIRWIHRAVLTEAKKLLADRRLTVQQVADELNFANPSFFGQFFKKYTGMTPKAYRDSL